MDTQPDRPSDDRTQLIAVAADGRTASVEVGSNAFAWRLPGVLLGALTVGVLHLFAAAVPAPLGGGVRGHPGARRGDAVRQLAHRHERRLHHVLRVSRADAVRGPLGRALQRAWQVIVGFIAIGLLLGLALSSKWVAAYAIGGLAILILLRSALGRIVALAGHAGHHGRAGGAAIRAMPFVDGDAPNCNWLFLVIMVGLTLALAAAMVRRPVRFTTGAVVAIVVPAVWAVLRS